MFALGATPFMLLPPIQPSAKNPYTNNASCTLIKKPSALSSQLGIPAKAPRQAEQFHSVYIYIVLFLSLQTLSYSALITSSLSRWSFLFTGADPASLSVYSSPCTPASTCI
jgi:hypothetical protein